ncbi:MAG: S41 family peptidase [bacterium]|nr:S41 family peptidase [bacterium]
MKTLITLGVALVAACSVPAQKSLAEGPPLSPFRGMRMAPDGIEVQVHDATWYRLEKVANVKSGTLLVESKKLCGPRWWKRITEDLPALLAAIDEPVGKKVDLVVRELDSGNVREFEAVEMTNDKRQRLRDVYRGRPPAGQPDRAVKRGALSAAEARADLGVLARLLEERFAYRKVRNVQLTKLLRDARKALAKSGDRVAPLELARQVDRILAAFGDAHSRLAGGLPPKHPGYLPFLVQQVEGGPVAFRDDRSGFVDADHPFVAAINGVPIERWLELARAAGLQGSKTMQLRSAERGLRAFCELRAALPGQPKVLPLLEVELRSADGASKKRVALPTARKKPFYGSWPLGKTRRLRGAGKDGADLGYLRLASMSLKERELDEIDEAMRDFRDTAGLVIDVRGNGGGRRDALRRLLPYFLAPDAAPVVTNVAAKRLFPDEKADAEYLGDRGLHLASWDGYDAAERRAIREFEKGFEPSWKFPARQFSRLHFLVQRHSDNPGAFHYDQPAVVLIDRGCYSATDIFAAAFSALPHVKLVGETTMGGSGRARSYVLPKSGIRLRLSSMASFQPNGTLFEHEGVVPDVAVATRPTDLIGKTDTVLQRAIELLR